MSHWFIIDNHESNTIGIGKKYGFDKIKKLFSKTKKIIEKIICWIAITAINLLK